MDTAAKSSCLIQLSTSVSELRLKRVSSRAPLQRFALTAPVQTRPVTVNFRPPGDLAETYGLPSSSLPSESTVSPAAARARRMSATLQSDSSDCACAAPANDRSSARAPAAAMVLNTGWSPQYRLRTAAYDEKRRYATRSAGSGCRFSQAAAYPQRGVIFAFSARAASATPRIRRPAVPAPRRGGGEKT